ncbi:N-acetyltransferase family protein [Halobacteriales archaeon Cl-PHB]
MTGAATGDLPRPPHEFTDDAGREIVFRERTPDDEEALVDLYLEFHPEDRAQGIPPVKEDAIREWLEGVGAEDCLNLVAWYDDQAVGHAMLVPGGPDGHELAIFVGHDHQGAGIGTELLRTLLGMATAEGVEAVWLTVERWNDPAIHVYRTVGFETLDSASFEIEMSMELD